VRDSRKVGYARLSLPPQTLYLETTQSSRTILNDRKVASAPNSAMTSPEPFLYTHRRKARTFLLSIPVIMVLVMLTRPLYAHLIDVFGDDGSARPGGAADLSGDNPVSMNMRHVADHWPAGPYSLTLLPFSPQLAPILSLKP